MLDKNMYDKNGWKFAFTTMFDNKIWCCILCTNTYRKIALSMSFKSCMYEMCYIDTIHQHQRPRCISIIYKERYLDVIIPKHCSGSSGVEH